MCPKDKLQPFPHLKVRKHHVILVPDCLNGLSELDQWDIRTVHPWLIFTIYISGFSNYHYLRLWIINKGLLDLVKIAKEATMDSNVYLAVGIGFVSALVFYAMSEVSFPHIIWLIWYGKVLIWVEGLGFGNQRLCGPMDKAPAYGAGDCRFESCLSQTFFIGIYFRTGYCDSYFFKGCPIENI